VGEDGRFAEEVATVFGVPFEVIPFKAREGAPPPPVPRHHVHALPERAHLEIRFPRVEGYTQTIRNRVTVDWDVLPPLVIDPSHIPSEVQTKGLQFSDRGRPSLGGPGRARESSLDPYRSRLRVQEIVFGIARDLVRSLTDGGDAAVPTHVLFPQLVEIVRQYVAGKVTALPPGEIEDLAVAPYYGYVVETLREAIHGDTTEGEAPELPRYETNRGPGSTADVSFWTSKDVREVERSHVNFVVADTKRWEQSAAYHLDRHPSVASFVKNAGLGFAIPYLHDGRTVDFIPDFIVKLAGKADRCLILETKGYDPLAEVKRAAAQRWVRAVNAHGGYGDWSFAMARNPAEIPDLLDRTRIDETDLPGLRDAGVPRGGATLRESADSAAVGGAVRGPASVGDGRGRGNGGTTKLQHPPLDRIVATIVERMDPERIVVFGSHARGDAGPDSDLDLMVEMRSSESLPRRAMAIDALFRDRDWPMDVFVFTPEEVERDRTRVGTLVHVIEQEGKVLYRRGE
jgi:predicted nucleotidyltransferase